MKFFRQVLGDSKNERKFFMGCRSQKDNPRPELLNFLIGEFTECFDVRGGKNSRDLDPINFASFFPLFTATNRSMGSEFRDFFLQIFNLIKKFFNPFYDVG